MKKLTKDQLKKAISQSVKQHQSGGQPNTDASKNMAFSLPSKTESQSKGPRKHLRKV